jgi:hypothetical protein
VEAWRAKKGVKGEHISDRMKGWEGRKAGCEQAHFSHTYGWPVKILSRQTSARLPTLQAWRPTPHRSAIRTAAAHLSRRAGPFGY